MSTPPAVLSQHTLLVKTLYRRILKEQLNWDIGRDVWLRRAAETRHHFEKGRKLTDAGEINSVINMGRAWLIAWKHPDPYTIPTQSGGSSFQRNTAPPVFTLHKDPDHPWP